MKKVLIITYYWPPSGGGGVQRWVKFVKYFRNFGWEPIVYTPENPEYPSLDLSLLKDVPASVQVIKTKIWEPYSFYKRFTGRKKTDKIQTAFLDEKKKSMGIIEKLSLWIRSNLFIPDARRFWINPSVRTLTKFLASNTVDVIITTGPPHSMHIIGYELMRKTGIKWLADFRDPWTNIDYYNDLTLTKAADKKHHKLERIVLKNADAVTVIGPGMVDDFKRIVNREYHVIPNGFDPEDAAKKKGKVLKSNKFSLAHIGSLTKTRNPKNLWNVLSNIITENKEFAQDLEILNVGKIDYSATESIKNFGLGDHLKQVNYLPHDKVIEEQNKATILLLPINNTPNAKLILTGKIFEYLVSGTPILCIGPTDGDAASVVKNTNCGEVFGFDDFDNLKKSILDYYALFKKGEVKTNCKGIDKYDRKKLTKKMADVMSSLVAVNQ